LFFLAQNASETTVKIELQCQQHQSRRHASMFTMFRSSDDHVLLTMYTAELK